MLMSVNAVVSEAENLPNFVVIFVDDLGYGDLGCYGSETIKTPRLDQMASEGVRFTSFYAQNLCGPSRSALLTGCYPLRNAKKENRVTPHPYLHLEEITIAEVLKPRGYVSACIGKWDQAGHRVYRFDPELMPLRQGFDYYFGTPSSNDTHLHWIENEKTVVKNADMATCTQVLTDKAIAFIDRNKDKPFFVYLAHPMPHVKLDATPKFKGKSAGGLYGDVVEELDYNVGRVIDYLSENRLAENTYVIFTSDNGPWYMEKSPVHIKRGEAKHGGSALPLRGDKATAWEGGPRVPCIVWRPGTVASGVESDEIVRTLDFLPTFAALAGAEVPTDRIIDGKDVTELLHGVEGAKSPSNTFYYYMRTQLVAVRKGDWKLHLPLEEKTFSDWDVITRDEDILDLNKGRLYNLKMDIGETTDVYAKHPDVVNDLLALAESARDDIGDYDRIGKGARFFDPQPKRPDIKRSKAK
jgi:arylsulfatase A-like enzyme